MDWWGGGGWKRKVDRDYTVFSGVRVPRQSKCDERGNQDEMRWLDLRVIVTIFDFCTA
jgi:hypothetical protein